MDLDLEIFLQTPEHASPEEIATYLDEACGDDAQLRERVEALISADKVPLGIIDQVPKISESSPDLETEGAVIQNYKLLQKIGEGGFGDVYMAEQFKPIKRRVALKIIKMGMDTRQVVARFEAERQALAMMDHPNIAKVHDGGSTEYQGSPDFARVFHVDYDQDGNSLGIEQALGTDPFTPDQNHPNNLGAPTFNGEAKPVLTFGLSDAARHNTRWILERSTDLITFERIYVFDGTADCAIEGIPIEVNRTAERVTITDENPPAGGAYYRFRAELGWGGKTGSAGN